MTEPKQALLDYVLTKRANVDVDKLVELCNAVPPARQATTETAAETDPDLDYLENLVNEARIVTPGDMLELIACVRQRDVENKALREEREKLTETVAAVWTALGFPLGWNDYVVDHVVRLRAERDAERVERDKSHIRDEMDRICVDQFDENIVALLGDNDSDRAVRKMRALLLSYDSEKEEDDAQENDRS